MSEVFFSLETSEKIICKQKLNKLILLISQIKMSATEVQHEKNLIRKIIREHRASDDLFDISARKVYQEYRRLLGDKKPVMKKRETKEFVEQLLADIDESTQGSPRLEIDGKLYKLGDTVMIGYGPTFHTKGTGGRKKKKTDLWKANTDRPDRILEENIEEDPDVGDTDEPDDEDYGEEEEDIPAVVRRFPPSITQSDSPGDSPVYTGEVESGVDYVEKPTVKYTGETLELAKRLGLDVKDLRIIPAPYERRVQSAEIRYKGYEKYEVVEGPDGKLMLKPYRPETTAKVKIIEGDYLPPPVPKQYLPKKRKTVPEPPKNYTGELRIGHCVKFVASRSSNVEGAVLRAGEDSFDVVSPLGEVYEKISYSEISDLDVKDLPSSMQGESKNQVVIIVESNDKPRKYTYTIHSDERPSKSNSVGRAIAPPPNKFISFKLTKIQELSGYILGYKPEGFVIGGDFTMMTVPYDHPTLEKIDCPERRKQRRVSTVASSEDFLDHEVSENTRARVVRILFDHLSSLFPGTYSSSVDNDPELKAIGAKINWDLVNRGVSSWESYYADEFRKWMFSRYEPDIRRKSRDFHTEAAAEALQRVDPFEIIESLTRVFGDDMFNGDGTDFLDNMERVSRRQDYTPTILDVNLRQAFARMGRETLEQMRGQKLGREIAHQITIYLQKFPPDPEGIAEEMKRNWIASEFDRIVPSQEERDLFDREHLVALQDIHGKWVEEFKINSDAAADWRRKRREIIQRREKIAGELKEKVKGHELDGKILSSEGLKLYENVLDLEQKIFVMTENGKTNFLYLRKLYEIILFIDPTSNPGKFSKFFRAKISSGLYPVEHLDSATLFHAFPEFFINEKISDADFERGLRILGEDIYEAILEFIRVWIVRGVSRRKYKPTLMNYKRGWNKLITDIGAGCGERIKKGANLKGDKSYLDDYNCHYTGKDMKYRCVAKREQIPLEDMILCYSDERFVCLSINDVLYALADRRRGVKDPINQITHKPYTKDFLDRMERRYGDLITDVNDYPERITELTAHQDYVLFGERVATPVKKPSPVVEKLPKKAASTPTTLKQALKLANDANSEHLVLYFYRRWNPKHKQFSAAMIDAVPDDVTILQFDLGESEDLWDDIKSIRKSKKPPVFMVFDMEGELIGTTAPDKDVEKLTDLFE